MNELLISLTMALAGTEATVEGPGRLALDLPLRMSLFNVEPAVEAPEVPAPSFTALVVAFELPSYSELQGVASLQSPSMLNSTESRPWTASRPATAQASSFSWLKDWSQR
jgi:hypothetical protein